MDSLARPSLAWPGLLALALLGCFDDPPSVPEDGSGSSGSTADTGQPVTTSGPSTADSSTGPTPADSTTGPDPSTTGSTDGTGPDDTGSSSTGAPEECDAPGGAVDDACPPAAPFCVQGSCVACSGGGDCSSLDPLTPVCGADDVCRPCLEHAECPDGAGCHLFEGSCLPADHVYYVDPDANCGPGDATEAMPGCTIQDAFGAAAGAPMMTIHLDQDVYFTDLNITVGRTIAIIGETGVTIADNAAVTVTVQGTAYLASIDVQNFDPFSIGVQSSGDVWLDDSIVRNTDVGVGSTMGRVVLRRTRVVDCESVGVTLGSPQTARIVNSIVANNGPAFPAAGTGVVTTGTGPVEVLYSTIVANTGPVGGAIDCGPGIATVRNSILASPGLTNAVDCAAGTTVTYSVVSDAEFDGDPSNLSLVNINDLMLDMDHQITAGSLATDVARWELGDPPTDINGVARPAVAGTPDYAGANIP